MNGITICMVVTNNIIGERQEASIVIVVIIQVARIAVGAMGNDVPELDYVDIVFCSTVYGNGKSYHLYLNTQIV